MLWNRQLITSISGWMTVVAWQALDASSAFLSGTLIQALLVVRYPEYNMTGWRGTLMVYAVLLFSVTINTVARSLLPRLEGLILIIHVMGFFGVLIPLVVLSDKISTHDVWTQFNNGGDFPTTGLSTMVGVLMSLYVADRNYMQDSSLTPTAQFHVHRSRRCYSRKSRVSPLGRWQCILTQDPPRCPKKCSMPR